MSHKRIFIHFIFALFLLFFSVETHAQVVNDNCSTATIIPNPESYCSPTFEEDNTFATQSNVALPSCANNATQDIWYSFTAIASSLTLIVNGNTFSNPGGTMEDPWVSLYAGTCANLIELGCEQSNLFESIVELHASGLVPGETYYFRVDGLVSGSFQYCIYNYFGSPQTSGDCPTAIVLCDKSPFTVQAVLGSGNNPNELDDATCFGVGSVGLETNSTWYKWTCSQSGTLTFALSPLKIDDDLDFAVYRLANGIESCANKNLLRCNAAGDLFFPSNCMGPTGLLDGETEISEDTGCDQLDDNTWIAPLNMVAGQSYALCINNFTSSGNGFNVSWGGTGQFLGPTAKISISSPLDTICDNSELIVIDSSTFPNGSITSWLWTFGEGASMSTSDTKGPHTLLYNTEGSKTIALTIKSASGCEVSIVKNIYVKHCCQFNANVNIVPSCTTDTGAVVTVLVPPTLDSVHYLWSTGQTTATVSNLVDGNYTVIVTSVGDCGSDTLNFDVLNTPLTLNALGDTTILNGGTANITGLANNPNASVVWNGGSLSNALGAQQNVTPTTTTTYFVVAVSGLCSKSDSVNVIVVNEKFEIPNAFTPNGDSQNDTFFAIHLGVNIKEFKVWDRWGELIWDDNTMGWDGTFNGFPSPSDVYIYRCVGKSTSGEEKTIKGDVTLLR